MRGKERGKRRSGRYRPGKLFPIHSARCARDRGRLGWMPSMLLMPLMRMTPPFWMRPRVQKPGAVHTGSHRVECAGLPQTQQEISRPYRKRDRPAIAEQADHLVQMLDLQPVVEREPEPVRPVKERQHADAEQREPREWMTHDGGQVLVGRRRRASRAGRRCLTTTPGWAAAAPTRRRRR